MDYPMIYMISQIQFRKLQLELFSNQIIQLLVLMNLLLKKNYFQIFLHNQFINFQNRKNLNQIIKPFFQVS